MKLWRAEDVRLEQYVLNSLAQLASFPYRVEYFSPEVVQQQRESFDKLLASLGTASEEEMDQILAEREPGGPGSELPPEVIARFQQLLESKRASS
ncbi:MAG: toxin-antitoxin system HicB family antitoxin [Blastocatellia bacterium]